MKKRIFTVLIFSLFLILGMAKINITEAHAAQIGDVLKVPEAGWTRYDDTHKSISYSSNIYRDNTATNQDYCGTFHGVPSGKLGETIKFNFTGNKIRLVALIGTSYTDKIQIEIDGKKEYFSARGNESIMHALLYAKENLRDGVHSVVITNVKASENPVVADFRFDAIDLSSTGTIMPYSPVSKPVILDIEPEREKIFLNQTVSADVTIDNITEIAAEDMIIEYDSSRLEFLGMEEVEGIKLVKDNEEEGRLRVILASMGEANIANNKKVLLKLNFKGIAAGEALVDITKGKISDGIEMECDLDESECGEAIIVIEDYIDVNKNGEFTLLDLAIDGRNYGKNPSDLPQYNTDIVKDGEINDEDLLKIGQYMLENPNYQFN